ncbi:MAG: hypothetical protein FWF54_01335, partial [Candidatus Azobacteroides sp.]|nr:hypothetical protein [Candidatus Azobacteroides sp.]
APVGTYNFTQVRNSGSFNKAVVIDDLAYLCGKDGLYTMNEYDDVYKVSGMPDIPMYKAVKFKDIVFACHEKGVSSLNTYTGEVKFVIKGEGETNLFCEDAVIYKDKLYIGSFLTAVKKIELKDN